MQRNWLLGKRIADEELKDADRKTVYGQKIVPNLAAELTRIYGKGYTRTSLYQYVKFYYMFPEIVQTTSGQSFPRLSWSHYVELIRVEIEEQKHIFQTQQESNGMLPEGSDS